MVKKLFALASVTALTGVFAAGAVAGCSSDSNTVDPGSDGAVDSGSKDSGKKETSPGDDEEDPGATCPKGGEWDLNGLETELGAFKAPKGFHQGVCSETELTTFETTAKKGGVPWADLIKGLSADCGSCILTSNKGTDHWGLILTLAPENKNGLINWGACPAAVQGDKACGVGFNNVQYCVEADCPEECGANGSAQANACVQKSFANSCKPAIQQMQTACTNADIDKICGNNILEAVRGVCGAGTGGDGGKD